ncbi:MAG: Hsp70 family protein [Myxococcota bacterium]
MRNVGIDLGTTNTSASLEGILVRVPQERTEDTVVPSVVAFVPSGARLVGHPARRRRAIDAKNTIFSAKRLMGRRWSAPETQEFRRRYPFDMVEMKDGSVGFRTRAGVFDPADIASMVLTQVRQIVGVGEAVGSTITVPAGASEEQRQATVLAGRRAGFSEVTLVEEPVAAALAYGEKLKGSRVAVYDLGGGTFDFALLDCSGAKPTVLGHGSDMFLGGDDVDHALAGWAADEVLKLHRWDLRQDPVVFDRLVAECERAKVRLSELPQTAVEPGQVDPMALENAAPLPLDRPVLARVCADLVRRTFITCDGVLRAAGISPRDVDAVVLAGGSTRLPMIRDGVEHYFGKKPREEIPVMHVVALGAEAAGKA